MREGARVRTATQTLHDLTSYAPAREWTEPIDDPRLVRDLEVNDLDRLPWFYKRYDGDLPETELPGDLPATELSAVEVLAGVGAPKARDLDLAQLGRLLHLSAGVVRTMERPYGSYLFRAAGSAGGRFPLELYVSVPQRGALPAGVHWYHPERHSLVQVGPPPEGVSPALVLTGVPWRTGWRYRERGYRHIYWDAGTMLSQLMAAASSAGIRSSLYTRFPDWEVGTLVGADGVHEFPVAVVGLGSGVPALDATGVAAKGAVDRDPLAFPLVTEAQRAGEWHSLGEAWPAGDPWNLNGAVGDGTLEEVVLARGSQRQMDPTRSISKQVLLTSLGIALRGITTPHHVAVHAVDDLDPGIYRWPDMSGPVRAGNFRDELYRVSLDQALARDAAAVVIAATDIVILDDRGYRDAHLGAGLVSGRLHLLAHAFGAGASGMTFLDSEIPSLVGEDVDGLLFTCIGVPTYRSARGGGPRNPRPVRQVPP